MKIRRVELTAFKRFTHLVVEDIPASAKLVILAGPNGTGKSSFFEGLYAWYRNTWSRLGYSWAPAYNVKQLASDPSQPAGQERHLGNSIAVSFYDPQPIDDNGRRASVYVRSAYRNDPAFQISEMRRMGSVVEEDRISRFIENDATVSRNYQRLASEGLSAVYKGESPETTIGQFRKKTIGDLQDAIVRLFPDLKLNDLGDPLSDGTFYFDKGQSKAFSYQNLSGGEKAAFDLILDIIVKKKTFSDSIYCIDEPEAHMNTRLQGALLQELFDLTPDQCQLWIATHSIGMMRRARDIATTNPGKVVFFDFGGRDFDQDVVLRPETPNRTFWQRALDVALDDLSALIVPETIVICEGSPQNANSGPNAAFDAHCYDRIFEMEKPEAKFISAGNAHEVETDRMALLEAMKGLATGVKIIRLVDRDDRSKEEIAEKRGEGIKVLSRRNLESFLFDDEVLTALCNSVGQPDKIDALLDAKATAVKNSIARGNAPDDLKSASGEIYVKAKALLQLIAGGNSAKAFMRSTLASLVVPGMATYAALRQDIFE